MLLKLDIKPCTFIFRTKRGMSRKYGNSRGDPGSARHCSQRVNESFPIPRGANASHEALNECKAYINRDLEERCAFD